MKLPVAWPEALGVNRIDTGMLCPDGIVTGSAKPWIENSGLSVWADETVTLPPIAESAACRVALDPSVTEPKSRVAGEIANRTSVLLKPLPAKAMVRVGFNALLRRVAVPVTRPVAAGEKTRGSLTTAPGPSTTGNGKFPKEKPEPVKDLDLMVSGLLPALLNRIWYVFEVPIRVKPKPMRHG
jgi:hypothetical protein